MAGNAIMWPILYPRMSAVTPTTYSNSMTYQEMLLIALAKIDEIVDFTVSITDRVNDVVEDMEKRNQAVLEQVALEMVAIRKENELMEKRLHDLIEQVAVGGIAFNPTNGTRHEDVSTVISNVYDFVRVHARSVGEIDATLTTVDQWEALTIGAKQFDLDPLEVTDFATP